MSGLTFPAGTPMNFRDGFDFYRLTYHYVWGPWKGFSIGVGAGLQLRNATIDFTSADGTLGRSNRNIGPVPLIKIWQRYQPLDFFWASSSPAFSMPTSTCGTSVAALKASAIRRSTVTDTPRIGSTP